MKERQLGNDTELETRLKRPEGEIDVVEMESVEGDGIPRYRLHHATPRRQEQTIHRHHAADQRNLRAINIDFVAATFARVNDLSENVRKSRMGPYRVNQTVGTGNADDIV